MEGKKQKSLTHWILLLLSCLTLGIGGAAGTLLLRFYFLHGGSRRWFSGWLQSSGCPILILPLWISYKRNPVPKNHVTPKLFLACCGIGVLTGLDNYMYAWGVSYLPVSTSLLLMSTQLAFNAVFAYLLVRQKFTSYSVNSVILLTLGSVMLSFRTSSDTPKGVSHAQYVLGFLITIGAAALFGLILPMIELAYKKTKRRITYTLVMEMQLIMSFCATCFCTVGMAVNKDFQAIAREAKASDVGEVNYYMALLWNAISWQLNYIGVFGVIFVATALLSGIVIAASIPVTEVLAVLIYREKFSGEKGMALALSMWGFASYLYGEYLNSKQASNITTENQQILTQGCETPSLREETTLEVVVEEAQSNACH